MVKKRKSPAAPAEPEVVSLLSDDDDEAVAGGAGSPRQGTRRSRRIEAVKVKPAFQLLSSLFA